MWQFTSPLELTSQPPGGENNRTGWVLTKLPRTCLLCFLLRRWEHVENKMPVCHESGNLQWVSLLVADLLEVVEDGGRTRSSENKCSKTVVCKFSSTLDSWAVHRTHFNFGIVLFFFLFLLLLCLNGLPVKPGLGMKHGFTTTKDTSMACPHPCQWHLFSINLLRKKGTCTIHGNLSQRLDSIFSSLF